MKNDTLISVRLPKPLADELKLTLHKEHFMTLSEALRSIIRDKYLKSIALSDERLIEEIKKIRDSLKKDESNK